MLVSDHGAGPADGAQRFLNPLFARLGYLRYRRVKRQRARYGAFLWVARLATPGMRQQLMRLLPGVYKRFRFNVLTPPVDWSVTRVYAPTFTWEVYLNLKGRQPLGIVDPADYHALRSEVFERLERVEEEGTGRRVFERLWLREEVYHGPEADRGPDIITGSDYEVAAGGIRLGDVVVERPEESPLAVIGGHRLHGILVAAGAECRSGAEADGVTLYDIAPTALHMLGEAVPEGLDGAVCWQLFTPEALARRPARYAPDALQGGTSAPREMDANDEATVRERLRGLGYIE
jgi:predicted AlkP superfamily phosphohydrolase/phosphomutase